MTLRGRSVLGEISRETGRELADVSGMGVTETDLDLYDAYTADEIF